MAIFDTLLGRTEKTDTTNETVAAQERYHAWGAFLDREIAELQALLGAGQSNTSQHQMVESEPSPAFVQALNPDGFALIEG